MVGEPVQQRAGEALRTKHFGPFVEGEVGGDQDGAPLVALAEDLEEQFRPGGGQGDEAQLIDGQQVEQPSFVPGPQRSALPRFHRHDAPARFPSRCTSLPWRCWTTGPAAWSRSLERQPASPHPAALAGNSPVYGPGWESPLVVAQGVAGKPGLFLPGRTVYFCPFQPGVQQDDALRLRQGLGERAGGQESGPAGGAAGPRRLLPGQYRAEEASGARNDRGSLLELLDLVVEGDTLVVTHIDRLSRGLTHGLQVIEGLHRAGVEFRSLSEDFDTATATGKLQLTMVLAFSEWWRNSIRERSVAGQAKARAEGRFPGRRPSLNERQREYIRAERSKGVSQRDLVKRLEVSRWTIQQVDR